MDKEVVVMTPTCFFFFKYLDFWIMLIIHDRFLVVAKFFILLGDQLKLLANEAKGLLIVLPFYLSKQQSHTCFAEIS